MSQNPTTLVRYRLIEMSEQLAADRLLIARLAITNLSDTHWANDDSAPFYLGCHWYLPSGEVYARDWLHVRLPEPLAPQQELELEVTLLPPPEGHYLLDFDTLDPQRGWYGVLGVPTLRVPLHVTSADLDLPRACLIAPVCLLHDAVGNQIRHQARALEARGYHVDMLFEAIDLRIPIRERQNMDTLRLEELLHGSNDAYRQRAIEIFQRADLYVFNFPVQFPLFEAITLVESGSVIVDYFGITPAHLWQSSDADYERLQASMAQLELVAYADYAIVHSDYTAKELLSTGAIDADRVDIVPLPVELDQFHQIDRKQVLERYGVRAEQPVLLYVGRMAGNKRVDVLIRALAQVHKRLPDTVLLLVGNITTEPYATLAQQLKHLAAELGVAQAVRFIGQVSDAELSELYQLADVFVTASLHEGFCIPVIEAMANATPVIGTRVSALPDTIGDAGLLFEPENVNELAAQILSLLESQPAYQK